MVQWFPILVRQVGLAIVRSADVDHDGRPDLILDRAGLDGEWDDNAYTRSSYQPSNWRLAHSLRNGTFSQTDAVAPAFKGESLDD